MKLFTAKRARAEAEAEAEAEEYSRRLSDVSDEIDRRYALIDLTDAAERLKGASKASHRSQRNLPLHGDARLMHSGVSDAGD